MPSSKIQEVTSKSIITHDEAVYLAKKSISPDCELIDYQLFPYSDEKIGFLASHQKLVLTVKKLGYANYTTKSFFVKTIPQVAIHAEYIKEKGVFRKESDFFRFVVPLLLENYNGEAWAPKCYLAKEDTIVLEDMKPKGFSNRQKIFDEDTLFAAVACVARFHTCSMLADSKLNGKTLNDLYPHVFQESEFKRTESCRKWFTTAINLLISLANDLDLDSTHIFSTCDRMFDEMSKSSLTKHNVINHGDLWSSNFIFDKDNNCNLVDFQLLRYTPPSQDLMQLIYLTTTREYRKKNEAKIIEYYYKNLKETLINNGFKNDVPSFEEILQATEEQRFLALVMTGVNYSTMMMDGKIGAEVMKDSAAYDDYFYNNRRPFVDKISSMDPVYKLRVEGVAREIAEMSLVADKLPLPS